MNKQVEQEDLEKEFNRFLDEIEGTPRMYHSEEQIEWGKDIARHFAAWQKNRMMKGLCFETKVYLEDDGCAEDYNYTEWLALENTEISEFPEKELGLKPGDTVQVIMVKEDGV